MATISLPNGESIWYADSGTNYSAATISSTEASYLAALMNKRERFDFEWANSTERGAQTGMVQGSRGYQIDTKTEYIYDASAWRLATPYIEFTGSNLSVPGSTYTQQTGWSVDATRSTDTSFVTVSGNAFTFVRAGVYLMSSTGEYSGVGSSAFQNWTTDNVDPPTQHISINGYFGFVGTVQSLYRISAANTPVYLWTYNNAGGTATLSNRRVRIVRLG